MHVMMDFLPSVTMCTELDYLPLSDSVNLANDPYSLFVLGRLADVLVAVA